MKTIDFSQQGGLPLTQDVIDYLQQSNIEMLAALGKAFVSNNTSTVPVIISGMARVGSAIADGYLFYGGRIVQFVQTTIPPITAGKELAVIIQETDSALVLPFFNGTTPAIKKWQWATLTTQDTGLAATSTQFAYSALQPLGAGLAANNMGDVSTANIALAAGTGSGTLNYRKNYPANTVHIWGSVSVVVANLTSAPFNPYYAGPSLPAGYIPAATVPFYCYYRYHNVVPPVDDSGKDYVRGFNAEVQSTGIISFGLIKASSNYTVTFNTIIPLD